TYALTGNSFLAENGFDTAIWEKKSNDNAYLYYPSLKNIIADDYGVGYTARFVLENTTSEPIVYGDDLSFTFDAVLDLEGKSDPVSVTSQISPLALAQVDFAIEHNGIPLDAVISYTVDLANGKLILKIDDRDAGSIAFDNESQKIIVIITEDLNAGENSVNMTYNGTSVPLFGGVEGTCSVTIGRAVPDIELPEATGLNYGQPLSASTLSDTGWSWADGTVIPTVTNSGYIAVTSVDDYNYIYTDVEGYSPAAHTLTKAIPVTVAAAVPTIVVMADTKAIPDSTVTLSAVVSNPNNSTLADCPAVSGYTYKIGDGAEQTITNSSFVIPQNIPNNSTITITAKTSATDNYAVGTGTVTVLVTDCTHTNKTLKYDENKHWYYCSYCGADIEISVHSGGTATCTSKAVCEVCGQEYGTVDSNNHTNVSSAWNYDGTGHWHICSDCGAQVGKEAHKSGGQATAEKAEICTVCKYEITPKLGQVAAPLITPNGGSFTSSQEITITCQTSGAAIYYTLDGTVPTSSSTKYTGAFTLTESATVKAIAIKIGMSNSTVSQAVYTITSAPVDPVVETVAAPVITPNGGSFTGSQEITITCQTDGAAIYYTLDGTVPTANSIRYTGAFTLTESTTVRAIAIKAGMNNSTVSQAVYTITSTPVDPVVETVAAPVITPNGGSFTGTKQVTITCETDGADIYYTTDGTTPTTSSVKYTGEITISSTTTIKAIAVRSGMENSDIVSVTFTKASSGGSGGSGGGGGGSSHRPSSTSYPIFNGRQITWEEIAAELIKQEKGAEATIQLNGKTEVPVAVIKAIDDRDLKVTFVVDSVRSWKTDGAEITAPAAADLSILTTSKLKTNALRGIAGIQFTINNTNIPTDIEIAFKAEHAGKFANLYKSVDGKLVFVTCAKIGADGKVILSGVTEKGDHVVMLCEFSDLLGDMNNDGVLNAMDASAILKDIVGLEKGKNLLVADFNGDGTMNAMDASAILKRVVGLA
ncbi:MAG: chitobiase/beta-hexosaminidase C-terminal domain-containing protein, partial [Oscillospiraceae bacterium]